MPKEGTTPQVIPLITKTRTSINTPFTTNIAKEVYVNKKANTTDNTNTYNSTSKPNYATTNTTNATNLSNSNGYQPTLKLLIFHPM